MVFLSNFPQGKNPPKSLDNYLPHRFMIAEEIFTVQEVHLDSPLS